MSSPLTAKHIHRPALERHARNKFNTLRDITIAESQTTGSYTLSRGNLTLTLDPKKDPEVFEHRVTIDSYSKPWFDKAGAGRHSRAYAESQSETCLISSEVAMINGSSRREFASFDDNQAFIAYNNVRNLQHAYEVIRPGIPCMLFTDHDQNGSLADLRSHQEGVLEFARVLFGLLNLPVQLPIILVAHRTKKNGGYLSTHLRFPTVSVESCNETIKAIHHLVKHTGKSFGGLDLGTHCTYQQLRIPGCSKPGSTTRLLPADGSELGDIGPLLVSNSVIRQVHITTEMVTNVITSMFTCSGTCNLKVIKVDKKQNDNVIPDDEVERITAQIQILYYNKTGQNPDSIVYRYSQVWHLDHQDKCIHSESHKSNGMYVYVKGRAVYCQCHGRCKSVENRPAVLLGYLLVKLSSDKYRWEQTPASCYTAMQTIDVMTRLPRGIPPRQLANHLACIGDFKSLLDMYAGCDTSDAWLESTVELSAMQIIDKPSKALLDLEKHVSHVIHSDGQSKKRKVSPSVLELPIPYTFDVDRFRQEHPSPLDIDAQTISNQVIDCRYIDYDQLDLSHRVNLVHSEMMTGKTSNLIIMQLKSLPKHARVIALTPKRLFAASLLGVLRSNGFDFVHYQDERFLKERPNLIVIEVESLWKLKAFNFDPYDYLLIDESESTITQMTCVTTHKHQIKNNWDVLVWLLMSATKVLLTDACMSMISLAFILDHCEPRDVHYIKNIHQIPLDVKWYMNKRLMEKHIKESVGRGETLYTFSGAKNNAINLDALTVSVFGQEHSVLYSGSNSHEERVQTELSDVNTSWATKKAIHVTPCITVGTSFDRVGVIQNIYLFPYTKTAGETQVAQASRRVRNPINQTINITIVGQSDKLPTNYNTIKLLLQCKSDLLLDMEKKRIRKDFDDDPIRLETIRKIVNSPYETCTLVNTYIRVIIARNKSLNNYREQMMRLFLTIGHRINIVRGSVRDDELITRGMTPEEKIFTRYNGATGIMAFYEENEDDLMTKQKSETLSSEEAGLVRLARYIQEFRPSAWPLVNYAYWMDYKHKLTKDKRLRMLVDGNREDAIANLNKSHRYTTALAEGTRVDEHTGIMHGAVVPELSRVDYHALAEPLFDMTELLGIKNGDYTTDSIIINMNSERIGNCLRRCRILLGPSGWNGQELPENPSFRQLHRFLIDMILVLIDGTLTQTSEKKVATTSKIETADTRYKSGKTTRAKRERILTYEIQFKPPKTTKGVAYNALQRVKHLVPLDEATDNTD